MPRPAPSPDRSARRRRSLRAVVGIGVVVGFAVAAGMPAATRAQPVLASALEAFRLDMAWLRPRADGTPRILVVDMAVPGPLAWRVPVAVLEREPTGSWVPTAEAELRIPDASLRVERPWLVGLDPDAFALVAPSEEAGRTTTIGFEIVDDGGGAIVHERWRTTIEEVVDDGGSADVDADGRPELVLGSARTLRQAGVCQGSSLWVVDARVGTTRAADIADVRLAAGVIGRFDLEPGDDLAAYAYPNCPAGPDDALEARLLVVRLADGTTSFEVPVARSDAVPWLPPPVRLDADGDGRHELLAQGPRGLMVFDAASDDTGVRIATQAAIPLGAMPSSATTPARVAWLEPAIQGRGSIGTELVRRDADGAFRTGPATVMWDPGEPSDRWVATIDGAVDGALGQTRPATVAAVSPDGTCDDLIVPLAIVRCGGTGLDLGPAWLGTRPLGLLATPDARRLLVASGTEWTPGAGPPAVPAPWTRGSDGRWRHGASPLFLLAEVDERDLVSGLEAARPNLDRTAHPGPVARLGAQRGVRLLTTVAARSDTALEPREPTLLTALGTPIGRLSEAAVLRISADTSAPSGPGRDTVDLALQGARLASGQPAERWAVMSVALDDRGEPSVPIALMVSLDTEPPAVALDVPAVTPIWPIAATLVGRVDPGTSVELVGGGSIPVDADGRFVVETPLAPWPQDVTVAATDEFGNRAERTVSVVGGIDYRNWPWATIVAGAVLVGVIGSGLLGRRRGRGGVSATVVRTPAFDEGPVPELEELAPGDGIGAARD